MVRTEIREYVEREILPRYAGFDAAHREDHAEMVICRSLKLAENYDVDEDMVYVIAAYHDTGLAYGRERHHHESRRILMEDAQLRTWFTPQEIAVMGDAVEDHRASSHSAPRTIYGCIVAEADRLIEPRTIIRRTIQFTLANHPQLDKTEGYERMVAHLNEKYNYGGYLHLWIEESENAQQLEVLRQIIAHKDQLIAIYDEIYGELTGA